MASDEAAANRTALIDLQTTERKLAAAITELDKTRLKLNSEKTARQLLAGRLLGVEFQPRLVEFGDRGGELALGGLQVDECGAVGGRLVAGHAAVQEEQERDAPQLSEED